MKRLPLILIFILVVIGYGQAKPRDKEEKFGKIDMKVLGESGSMRIGMPGKFAVVILFDAIRELNANGSVVGASGRKRHSINSFARQEFNFSNVSPYTYNGLKTKTFNFTASLVGSGAILNVEVYIFLESGEFENGGESTQVKNGTAKFNIKIENWEFCSGTSNCMKNEVGEFLDFVIVVKSKIKAKRKTDGPKPPPGKKRGKEFDLGDGTIFSLSEKVEVDGTTRSLPKEPSLDISGNIQKFIFRFPKFVDRVLYDPVLTFGDTSEASAVKTSAIVFLGALLAAILAIY